MAIPDPLGCGQPIKVERYERLDVGQRKIDSQGYVQVMTEDGLVHEAKIVVERAVGRKLRKDEWILHKARRSDNRLASLELRAGTPQESMRVPLTASPGTRKPTRYAIVPKADLDRIDIVNIVARNKSDQAIADVVGDQEGFVAIPAKLLGR